MSVPLCPRCGAENPAESSFCKNCGARLNAPPRPAAGSTGEEQLYFAADLPDWLDGELAQEEDNHGNEAGDADVPDWLQVFQETDGEEEEIDMPMEGAGVHEPYDNEIPDWLGDLGEVQEDAGGDERPAPAESADARAAHTASTWLDDLSPEEMAQPDDPTEEEAPDELHAWLDDLEAAPEPETVAKEQEPEEDLDDFSPFMPQPGIEAPGDDAEDGFHSWLQGDEPSLNVGDATAPGAQSDDDEFADWLAAAQREPEDASTIDGDGETEFADPAAKQAGAGDPVDLSPPDLEPDWLGAAAREDSATSRSAAGTPEDPADAFAAEMEAWLGESGSESSGDSTTAAGTPDQPSVPDDEFFEWLATLDDSEAESTAPATEETPSTVDPSAALHSARTDEEIGSDTVMDTGWLDELADAGEAPPASEATPAEEMPDWLRAIAPTGATGPLPALPADEDHAPNDARIDEELDKNAYAAFPGWLQGVTSELPSPDELALEGEEEIDDDPPAETEPARADEEGVPAWLLEEVISTDLGDVAEEPAVDTPAAAPKQEETAEPWPDAIFEDAGEPLDDDIPSEDLPAWFSDVMANIGGDSDSEETMLGPPEMDNVPPLLAASALPAWLDSPFTEEPEAEPTPLEEIPEWLRPSFREQQRTLAEQGRGDVPAIESSEEWNDLLGAFAATEEGAELEQADVPEWLEALRPEEAAPAAPAVADATPVGDAEEEGPLAGLPGVVGIAPVVAQSFQAQRVVLPGTTEEQEAQAALLRQLTRSDQTRVTMVEAPVQLERTSLPFRGLVALLLLAAVLVGVALPELLPAMSTPPTAESVDAFAQAVVAAAEQPVLVAFDYTPAYAGALTPRATVLLEHLARNGSHVLLASQSAAGTALASEVAAQTKDLVYQNVGYVPGATIGLRSLASCVDEDTPCTELYGGLLDSAVAADLANAALIIVVTGERDSLVGWVEQVGATTELPVLTVLTQALEPVAAPYLASRQIAASIAGVEAAQQYAQAQGSSIDNMNMAPLVLARWLSAALLILGAVYYLVGIPLPLQRKGQSRR